MLCDTKESSSTSSAPYSFGSASGSERTIIRTPFFDSLFPTSIQTILEWVGYSPKPPALPEAPSVPTAHYQVAHYQGIGGHAGMPVQAPNPWYPSFPGYPYYYPPAPFTTPSFYSHPNAAPAAPNSGAPPAVPLPAPSFFPLAPDGSQPQQTHPGGYALIAPSSTAHPTAPPAAPPAAPLRLLQL
ncbi:hypothetical protein OF83DRAFT_1169747 [Amylostereum chailletii]|nr:hypothetical protein OF83DRAFT_1169747 [Amylostereum chailletii]